MKILRKILKWTFLTITGLIMLLIIWFLLVARDSPPEVSDKSAVESVREKRGEDFYTIGNNWLRKSETGLWEMYVEGEPFERGVAFGKLTKDLLSYQEEAFFEQMNELIPSTGYLKFLKYFIAWFNRNLDKNITDEYKLEIYGTSFSCDPRFDFIGTGYQRQLNYHAAHDIGHALQGLNMVGCTSFSCWDSESSDSALITGRNFDFYAGRKFARNKIVCFFNPSQGYKFMMISWATMSGAVSGMNEKGLTVTINAAKSSVPFQAATPVSLVAREILQYAENISEAYEIAKRRKMFVSETFLISSAADGKSVIIEKSPEKCGIVIPVSDYIICSNHYQGETFSDDKTNLENIRSSDSKFRYNRVDELVNKLAPLEVSEAASILRDRFAPGNKDPGPGNPMAINQLIAHHSVIFKPEELIVWVSEPPYQLGRYIAYDLKKVFSLNAGQIAENMEISSPELTIPADTFLYSESYRKYEQFLNLSEDLKEIKNSGRSLPDSFEIRYISSNPGFYLTYSKLGEYYYATGNYRKAYEYFDSALTRQIPGENVRDNLLEMKKNSIINSDNAGKRN